MILFRMTRHRHPIAIIAILCACADSFALRAQELSKPDKGSYTLFNPTPDADMRELSADRPDKTDSPFTVDAGHFQVELSLVTITYNERGEIRSRSVEVAPMNIKAGLLTDLDFQLIFTPYRWDKSDTAGTTERKSGFDGITPRFKLNLVGNDGGPLALALMPSVSVPLSQDRLGSDSVEGGLGIPFAFELSGWEIGLQTTFKCNSDASAEGHHFEADNSLSIGHPIIGKLSAYVEFFSSVSTETGTGWVGTVDTWLTYQINKNLRLDGGVYIGVTSAADDWQPWLGLTFRY